MRYVISFDLDGTLVKSGFGDMVWLDGLPRVYAKEKKVSFENAKNFFIKTYNKIGSDHREWYDLSFWIKTYNLPITPKILLDRYEHYIKLYKDVKPVIQRLSKKYVLIISSGAMNDFIQKELEFTQLQSYFIHTFSSTSDTNTVKKDPDFYKIIADKLNCVPSDIIHIGDHLEYDYYSAKKAGCYAFHLDRDAMEKKHFIVSSLKEFEKKLQEYNLLND